ncbi:MAG: L-2-hydroxyglutarate oxidase [Woeseiaceae bacterium]|nr:L-2-hydroxyglutarate oxidase [Woeseiaceae bacterium]
MRYDYAIIGGGIVGLSTAWQLLRREPGKKLVLLEKEDRVAAHQTGHNSGVIHAGIYYEPGSLKAKFCKQGVSDTIAFCDEHGIPYEQCGKLIVATNDLELERLEALFERAKINELDVVMLDKAQLAKAEPNITGIAAIHLKTTGIVSFPRICRHMADSVMRLGGDVRLSTPVTGLAEFDDGIEITTPGEVLEAGYLVACGGLMADRIADMMDIETDFRIVPYRGEYFQLPSEKNDIVSHLIYPVPDPDLPFLGVHLTRMIDGSVTVGPNAVQAWSREGYGRINVSLRDAMDMLRFPGFWKVALRYIRTGVVEYWNSLWRPGYLKQVRKYCPSVELSDLKPYPPGVRAQAVLRDGTLVQDFLFAETARSLHVCNAPSPAATSAIPIGAHICDKILAAK